MSDIVKNLFDVKSKIAQAAKSSGRNEEDIRFILVSKTIASEKVLEAIRAGQILLGENKVQEGKRKSQELSEENLTWSMIGHLQSNKVKDVLTFASEVQSVDRLSLAKELNNKLQAQGRSLDILVQVNTSGEASKFGLHPDAVQSFLKELPAFHSLNVKGFMTLATLTPDEQEVRRCFRLLKKIRDTAQNEAPQGENLKDLSMGMSGDYEWAIEEGATTVRIGQAVFGPRNLPNSYYWPEESKEGKHI